MIAGDRTADSSDLVPCCNDLNALTLKFANDAFSRRLQKTCLFTCRRLYLKERLRKQLTGIVVNRFSRQWMRTQQPGHPLMMHIRHVVPKRNFQVNLALLRLQHAAATGDIKALSQHIQNAMSGAVSCIDGSNPQQRASTSNRDVQIRRENLSLRTKMIGVSHNDNFGIVAFKGMRRRHQNDASVTRHTTIGEHTTFIATGLSQRLNLFSNRLTVCLAIAQHHDIFRRDMLICDPAMYLLSHRLIMIKMISK